MISGELPEQLSADDVLRFVSEKVREGRYLDFKARPYAKDSTGTHELLKDICAFANADGGFLVVGIADDGAGRAFAIVNVEDAESIRQSMFERCLHRTEPRLSNVTIQILLVGSKTVLVCRIPSSDQKPVCACPDRESHFFWRRYEDGNRLMTVAEMRQCLEGDRVAKSLRDIEHALQTLGKTGDREFTYPLDEEELLSIKNVETFLRLMKERFKRVIGSAPYYRLTSTPNPINVDALHLLAPALHHLVKTPPKLRQHGFDISVFGASSLRESALGIERTNSDGNFLGVCWNGHTEFWTKIDGFFLQQDTGDDRVIFFNPAALSEPVGNFVRLVRDLCATYSYEGKLEFSMELWNVNGLYLAPGHPNSIGYMKARSDVGKTDWGAHVCPDETVSTRCTASTANGLPGEVHWDLISAAYRRFGYLENKHVPFFDETHQFTLA